MVTYRCIPIFAAFGPALAPVGFNGENGAELAATLGTDRSYRIEGGNFSIPRISARFVLGVGFVLAGVMHFLRTSTYTRVVPTALGHSELLVYVSGVFEILGGIGVMIAPTRRPAGIGLIALLIAVFPANIYMAMHPELFADIASRTVLLWRLPFQLVLVAWVWWCCF